MSIITGTPSISGQVPVRQYIYNTVSLQWEPATGSTSAGTTVTVANFPATYTINGNVGITDGVNTAGVIQADNQMGLVTITPGHISTLNSTSTPIASGATWTGQAEESTNHGVIQLIVKSSHDSAVGGLVVEYSPDGTNWDSSDQYSIFANVGKLYSFQPASKYYRVRYTNGGTQQTYFRLQTSLKPYYVKPSSHRIADLISEEDDAELVKAVLTAEMPNNTFTPINATAGGNLKVAVEEIEPGTPLDTIIANQTNGTQVVKGNVTPANTFANPSTAVNANSLLSGWNTVTWDRLIAGGSASDGVLTQTNGTLQTQARLFGFNGTTWDRLRSDTTYGLDVDVTRLPQSYEEAVSANAISGSISINKFGAAPNGIQTTATDVWSRADSVPTQQIWLAPTAARIHNIASSDANDDGSPVGTGARTLRIYGLQTWSSAESSEDITMNGISNVATVNSYVIIHRMKVLTTGSSGPNVGTITATAQTDATITAIILPGDGQTEMAIYGVPSGKTAYLCRWGCGINNSTSAVTSVDFRLLVNENPNVQTTAYLRKDDMCLHSNGTSQFDRFYKYPAAYVGPCIIKIQGIGSSNDIDAVAGFDLEIK